MHGMENRVAVLEQQIAPDKSYLRMRRESAAPVIEHQLLRRRQWDRMDRSQNNHTIFQSAVLANQQSFVRNHGAAERTAFKNRQGLGLRNSSRHHNTPADYSGSNPRFGVSNRLRRLVWPVGDEQRHHNGKR